MLKPEIAYFFANWSDSGCRQGLEPKGLSFAAARPRRDGYTFTAHGLEIAVEVDVRDSRRRRTGAPGLTSPIGELRIDAE